MIDRRTVDWNRVSAVQYVVRQRFRYAYPAPISDLRHRLVIRPFDGAGQRRLQDSLRVSPEAPTEAAYDAFGNEIVHFSLPRLEGPLDIEFEATVERDAAGVRRAAAALLRASTFRAPTPLTRWSPAMSEAAVRLRRQHKDDAAVAAAISAYVHEAIRYTKGVTDVTTTAIQAFERRRGVCQDYAHVMIAIARCCGIPARYVSGYRLGEGATHAWVEVLVPDPEGDGAVVQAFDPTRNTRESLDYIIVAIGRDYADVAPTSGTFQGAQGGVLTADKNVDVAWVRYRDDAP
jgi:transglutaminase-like putative cysteine protease